MDSPTVEAAYVVERMEKRLRGWVRDNARSWGADDVNQFDDLLVAVRRAANAEGVTMAKQIVAQVGMVDKVEQADSLLERDRMWCTALLMEGAEIINRVTGRFIRLREADAVCAGRS